MTSRDVSMLASNATSPSTLDRTPTIAPPSRSAKARSVAAPVKPAEPAVPLAKAESAEPVSLVVARTEASPTTRLSLHLDVEQHKWMNAQAKREDVWPGQFLEALLVEHSAAVVQAGMPRRRRRRSAVGRSSSQVLICSEEFKRMESAAASVGASKTAFVREVIDVARNK